jgi:hypothetical protein
MKKTGVKASVFLLNGVKTDPYKRTKGRLRGPGSTFTLAILQWQALNLG